jgi:signal transduction histidine kinase/CheY-like chemotaxis protein
MKDIIEGEQKSMEELISDIQKKQDTKSIQIIKNFKEILKNGELYQLQSDVINQIQETLFSYSQFDFSEKMDPLQEIDNLSALAYTINIHGEELKEVYEELSNSKLRLEQNLIELEEAMAVKDNFLAKMSHEMRTPLNSIIGFTDLLQDSIKNQKDKEKLEIILNQSHDLLSLINNVLDLSKIKSDKFSLSPDHTELKTLIQNKINPLVLKAEEKNTFIYLNFDENLYKNYIIDKVRLGQVFTNLINNAIMFTKNGKIFVNVILIKSYKETEDISFEIKDTGEGISPNAIEQIFNPFTQDITNGSSKSGTGLGLTIVKDLINLMGGEIKVKSKLHEGTSLSFILNLKKSVKENIVATMGSDINLENHKVLIVDDSRFNRIVIRHILSKWGAECIEAENGNEAIEQIKKSPFDIVFMDFHMPMLDGIETTKIIRNELQNNLPIIGLSANTVERDIAKSLEAGMNGYVSKPIDKTLLIKELLPFI